jgi:hypothetical protein
MLLVATLCTACSSDNGEVSFKSGGITHTFSEGPGSIPKGFPLPLYPNSTTTGSVSADGGSDSERSKFLMLASKDSVEKVSRYYLDELKSSGWKVESPQSSGKLINLSASQADMEANIMVSGEAGKTTISLSVSRIADGSDPQPEDSAHYEPNKVTPPTD